jgi:regulator of cell morphogenesis and NO signaling
VSTEVDATASVRKLVADYPQTRPVFERLGIDYCCGGNRTLEAAAAAGGVALETLLAAVRGALETPAPADERFRDWSAAPPAEVADYIERRHHAFMHANLPRLERLLGKVLAAHAQRHGPMLTRLMECYDAMDAALAHHLYTEELVVFPMIREAQAWARGAGRVPPRESLVYHLQHLEEEHSAAGRELERLRQITADYRLPEDACESFCALYEGLQEMEDDLHQHVHLENNVLFPKVRALRQGPG